VLFDTAASSSFEGRRIARNGVNHQVGHDCCYLNKKISYAWVIFEEIMKFFGRLIFTDLG
jgi:hypothetical protein